MSSLRILLVFAVVAVPLSLFCPSQTSAQSYLQRPLVLRKGTFRVDLAPSDYGYMDHGGINTSRGFRVKDLGNDTGIGLGAGLAYGLGQGFELGGLVLPLQLSPDSDVGDLEAYGRYGLTRAIALQATLQIPTQSEVGVGLGMPILIPFGGGNRIETGIELEFIFYDDTVANFDVPVAFQFAIGRSAFFGPRTGVFLPDFNEAEINLGVQGGVSVTSGLDLSASFNFPTFITTAGDDPIDLNGWEVIMGAVIYI